MSDITTPRDLARQSAGVGIEPSDGPTGDVRLDDVCERLERSVAALVDASAAHEDVAGDTGVETTAGDAGDVVTRAHEAQEALQTRLREAQA